ncbi:MAG TPA: S1 RNA-binding domain-containing protein [Planctomycetota bacterium]
MRETLLDAKRARPVVALTTAPDTRRAWIDPAELAGELGARAEVVLLETGAATWALGAALPRRLDVYGGAARIWWPGLTEGSDPFDHVLFLIHDEREAARARERIVAAIRAHGRTPAGGARVPPAARPRPAERREAGRPPDPWERVAQEYRVGDVVPARVYRLEPTYALVELLPRAGVVVPLREIDYTWVRDPAEVLSVGERVNVKLKELDPPNRRGLASIREAHGAAVRQGLALRPGERPYLDAETAEESLLHLRRELERERETRRRLERELQEALDDRRRLAQQGEDLKQGAAAARKELRSVEDRLAAAERLVGELDPLASEPAFLAAVRVEHARRFDEADRARYPLGRMRVGHEFMASLRQLEGLESDKVVEVCAQVASGRAHEIPGRAVHELTEGVGGRAILRAADGARAWRCALQIGSPSARRLHWWSLPERGGVEFASVAVHDAYTIPE